MSPVPAGFEDEPPHPAANSASRKTTRFTAGTIDCAAVEGFSFDRYLVDQLIRPIANLYRITPLAAGETPAGAPVAFVRQKKMAIREDIRFYADESESQELFRIKARSVLDTG